MSKDIKGLIEDPGEWLTGQLLVAMPSMIDPRFEKTIIFICSHSPDGAMGLVLNRLFGEINFEGLLEQFDLKLAEGVPEKAVFYGGPVEPVRGFVLHSSDYKEASTTEVTDDLSLTATVDVLKALSQGQGPSQSLLLLGYAGWAPGQLETEIQANGWLTVPADDSIIFNEKSEGKWEDALTKIGVSPTMLSSDVGHA